jgi:enoyl-[acyl-carrier protein] reductase I
MEFLKLKNKKIVIFGVANRRSVAFFIAKQLVEVGALPIFSVQNPEQMDFVKKSFPNAPAFRCDVTDDQQLQQLVKQIRDDHGTIAGVVHSVAFANYPEGIKPFHETPRQDFLQAMDVSCFSFIRIAGLFKDITEPDGAFLTISISTTRMAAESYGYMAPIKAALDSSVCFLAKSLSRDSRIRVNAVGASLLKTSASAGIPGYVKPYLFAEKATLRKAALKTEEVANAAIFLLSPRSSGINASTVVVDAGMSTNFFDSELIDGAV